MGKEDDANQQSKELSLSDTLYGFAKGIISHNKVIIHIDVVEQNIRKSFNVFRSVDDQNSLKILLFMMWATVYSNNDPYKFNWNREQMFIHLQTKDETVINQLVELEILTKTPIKESFFVTFNKNWLDGLLVLPTDTNKYSTN